jgi:hypothetical protein
MIERPVREMAERIVSGDDIITAQPKRPLKHGFSPSDGLAAIANAAVSGQSLLTEHRWRRRYACRTMQPGNQPMAEKIKQVVHVSMRSRRCDRLEHAQYGRRGRHFLKAAFSVFGMYLY